MAVTKKKLDMPTK